MSESFLGDTGEPVPVSNQAENFLTKVRQKHVYGALHEIHAGCSLVSIAIKRGVDIDEMQNIGDTHANIISVITILLIIDSTSSHGHRQGRS